MVYVIRQIHVRGKSALASDANAIALAKAAVTGDIVIGKYLSWSDPNACDGRGDDSWTNFKVKALRFDSFEAATACWKAQSTLIPFRPDGEPNRPLTAWSVTIEELK